MNYNEMKSQIERDAFLTDETAEELINELHQNEANLSFLDRRGEGRKVVLVYTFTLPTRGNNDQPVNVEHHNVWERVVDSDGNVTYERTQTKQ